MKHEYVPSQYFRTIGSHPAAYEVTAGEQIRVHCIDAHGIDGHDVQVCAPGNPMSGPIAINGIQAGDVLAVTFAQIIPLRTHGWSYPTLAGNVVDPEYVPHLPHQPGTALPKEYWDYDPAQQTLRSRGTFGQVLTLPYEPMVGCFGVAPDRGEAISTATSAAHGGNMDYRHFTTGCTIYLPVFVDQALFHIGDGHLRQGCGEIGGTGVESAIAVDLHFAKAPMARIQWIRAEDAQYLYAVGNARPLDQALQHATSEMHRFLQDCGADTHTAAVLMSQAIEYDIGNVFDPAYTVACKIRKEYLASHGLRSSFRNTMG